MIVFNNKDIDYFHKKLQRGSLAGFWICLKFWICQGSAYTRVPNRQEFLIYQASECARVLNIQGFLIYFLFWVCQSSEFTRILVLICVCHASGLFSLQTFIKFSIYASLLYFSLDWIFLYNCNCFQLGKPSWNFNPGWTSQCNQALKIKDRLCIKSPIPEA